jgi:ribonuclease-3
MSPKPTTRPKPGTPLEDAASRLGYTFSDPALLERALTHRSLAFESPAQTHAGTDADNEQLEFVGDAVLGLVVAESMYRRFPDSREGELTRLRASIVSRKHLGEMAARLELGTLLRLGKGEERTGGRSKPALLANALEAVIAAIYLDGGLPAAAAFIERSILSPALPELNLAVQHDLPGPHPASSGTFSGAVGDFKSALQEHLQAIGARQPKYVLESESGPDHCKHFCVEVRAENADGVSTVLARAEGSTKKAAQQEAARIAFTHLLQSQPESSSVASAQRGVTGTVAQ